MKLVQGILKLKHFSYSVSRHYSNRNVLKLHERGMYKDIFPDTASAEIVDLLNAKPQCVYAGFDPTADSLHIGNLLVIINLLHWQRSGHRVIVLVGGATGYIGDPSERTTDRPALSAEYIKHNVSGITENVEQLFKNHDTFLWKGQGHGDDGDLVPVTIVNNYTWYEKLNVLSFMGNIGRNFRMGTMLSRHSVGSRIASETGMSFTEFTYQIFQAYDWLYLLENYDCRFQIGGSDQMGNIVSGHDLISRVSNRKVYGLTVPLVTTETGNKFGKSEGNAIWLNREKTSPFELYQFFIRSRDSEVENLLKLFTFYSTGKINEIMQQHKVKPEARLAQKKLAEQVTVLVHGESGLSSALQITTALYDKGVDALSKMSAEDITQVFKEARMCELLLKPGMTIYQLALEAGCFSTEDDAARIISAGGFYVNQQRCTNLSEVLTLGTHILLNNITLLRVGKRKYFVVKWKI
ncbi:tyrosine--tRNA ligase, mitochondrial [Schistocerca gregaria]|uniref:tyrosine--tRNA ligase, mitochondrial n=1 Tax=Schistocerca gregaria TaxID=7010 RepID=UPI00211EB7C6|nr:tyrosine--tRNA ligase, mitochondrial [Schistocerca gregaria]